MHQDAVFADQRRLDTGLPQAKALAGSFDLEFASRREVELVTKRFGNDQSARRVNGNDHGIMVARMA